MASVLVVDSDPVARKRIVTELRAMGYDVEDARSITQAEDEPLNDRVTAGGIAVDVAGHWVIVDDDYLNLSPREYDLLLFLLQNKNRVFSRKQLLSQVWGGHDTVGQRTVDVHIRRLRSVLEPYGKNSFIQTVRGAGYRFSLNP